MNQLKYFFVAGLVLITCHSAYADSFNIRLSDNTARFSYSRESFGGDIGPLDLDMGLFFSQDHDKMLHLGMMVRNDTLDNPFVISIGARAYYGDVGNKVPEPHSKFAAISLGGELLFIPDSLGGFGLGLYYFYAPTVVTYMDADNFREYGVSLNYEITRQATVSIGYQKIKIELKSGADLEIDSSAYFGIGLRF